MKFPKNLESVGWIFWGVVFVVLIYPAIHLTGELTYDIDTGGGANRYMIGIFGAAIAAALFTWLFNLALERIVLWTRQSKKKKKKTGGRKKNKG